jgi:hypothetical protein
MSVRVPPAVACLHRQSAIRCELDVLIVIIVIIIIIIISA